MEVKLPVKSGRAGVGLVGGKGASTFIMPAGGDFVKYPCLTTEGWSAIAPWTRVHLPFKSRLGVLGLGSRDSGLGRSALLSQ